MCLAPDRPARSPVDTLDPAVTEDAPAGETRESAVPTHPNVPRRGAVLLALTGVVVAGVLGVMIGWGLVDTSCTGSCDSSRLLGAFVGGAIAAGGAAIVAVLVLRAMSEWHRATPGQDSSSARPPRP